MVDTARTCSDTNDLLHGRVTLKGDHTVPFALHAAVGGDSDAPVPGDVLAGALASCLDSTIRVVAEHFRVELDELVVAVQAHVDVRGTLLVDATVPVGFQRMEVHVRIVPAEGTPPGTVERLVEFAERCCVVMQTLRSGVEMVLTHSTEGDKGGENGHAA